MRQDDEGEDATMKTKGSQPTAQAVNVDDVAADC
jgi:hypothetical protein